MHSHQIANGYLDYASQRLIIEDKLVSALLRVRPPSHGLLRSPLRITFTHLRCRPNLQKICQPDLSELTIRAHNPVGLNSLLDIIRLQNKPSIHVLSDTRRRLGPRITQCRSMISNVQETCASFLLCFSQPLVEYKAVIYFAWCTY